LSRWRLGGAYNVDVKSRAVFLTFLPLFTAPVHADEKPGEIVGVVRFTGTVPPAKRIVTADGATIEHRDLVVDAKTKGLRDVIVVLADAPAQPKLKDAKPVVIDQRDMVFTPRVVSVQHGQKVRFDNNDICNHAVTVVSKAPGNSFNVVAAPGSPIEREFEPEDRPIVVGCSLHAWMRAYVFVAKHPWHAVSDEKGALRLKGVPPGRYTLLLMHPDTGRKERRPIEVKSDSKAEVNVEWGDKAP
jgi:plastocyanin